MLWLAVFIAGASVAVSRLLILQWRGMRERDELRAQLIAALGQQAADRYMHELMARWEVASAGVEFTDGDEAAHAFADFLANQTGQPIVAQQLDGDGVIVAIPDDHQEAT